jgi:protein-L-isoaspartate(D-aspartate) O-methyltransferase
VSCVRTDATNEADGCGRDVYPPSDQLPWAGRMTARPTTGLAEAARLAGVRDLRVLDAVATVPRALLVPPQYAGSAYLDEPIPIPHHQVTTQPSLSARMVEALHLTGTERVLEVGTGYGYQTALLARLCAFVTSVERWADLADHARRNLAAAGVGNVRVVAGDGTEGVPEFAPYEGVIVSAAYPDVPSPLVAELDVGGRLVQPIGPGGEDEVTLFKRVPEGLVEQDRIVPARFVRLYGRRGYRVR